MATISFPLPVPPVVPQLSVGAVVAAAPVALLASAADAFLLPQAQVLPSAASAARRCVPTRC
jgi:hypothetical protein